MLREPALFTIVIPVSNRPVKALAETIESVLAQTFAAWELILVHDGTADGPVGSAMTRYTERESRIKVAERDRSGGFATSWNSAVAQARGRFLALVDHGDLLAATTLERTAIAAAEFDDVDYLYSDEDRFDATGRVSDVVHKPEWSPERLRGHMYAGHISVLRTSLVREVGGLREGFEGAEHYDLVLRVSERARRVVHVPEILYHRRTGPGTTMDSGVEQPEAGRRAVQEHLDRVGIDGTVESGDAAGTYRISRRLRPELRVSVVIPTMGKGGLVWGQRRVLVVDAVRSMLEHTEHENVEIVVVYDPPTPQAVLDQLRKIAGGCLLLVPFHRPFVHGEKMNVGVLHSTGQRIVLINDDVEVISSGWLEELVAPLDEPDVGMTGAKLYFGDTTIQHAGHAYADGTYFHPFYRVSGADRRIELSVSREASGVTAACAAMRRDTYFEVGGFTEQLPTHFNDVDLCYKVRSLEQRILWMANVELFHFASVSRGQDPVSDAERRLALGRWGRPDRDPYLPAAHAPTAPARRSVGEPRHSSREVGG